MTTNNDYTVDFDVPTTMQEVEALTKTLGIAINNLLTKQNRLPHEHLRASVSAELGVLIGYQNKLFAVMTQGLP